TELQTRRRHYHHGSRRRGRPRQARNPGATQRGSAASGTVRSDSERQYGRGQRAPNARGTRRRLQPTHCPGRAISGVPLNMSKNRKRQHTPERRTTLAVCIIARNEEEFIGACLESVRGVGDEMIVFDAGYTAGTVEIVRGL